MSNVSEQNEERNRATGQTVSTPSNNETTAGSVPVAVVAQAGADDDPHDAAAQPPIVQAQLFAVIDGQRQPVPFNDLTDEPRRLLFKQRCQQAEEPVTLHATEFFMLAAAVRFLLFKFVKDLGDQVRLQIGDGQEQSANVFDAVIAAFPTATSTESQTAAKQASIEAAALVPDGKCLAGGGQHHYGQPDRDRHAERHGAGNLQHHPHRGGNRNRSEKARP